MQTDHFKVRRVRAVSQPAAPRHLPAATPEGDARQYPRRR